MTLRDILRELPGLTAIAVFCFVILLIFGAI